MIKMLQLDEERCLAEAQRTPRLGFAGAGWIGFNRMEAAASGNLAQVAAVLDPQPEAVANVVKRHPMVEVADSYEHLLEMDLDAIVIATPSALHAAQSVAALQRGFPVFCQKPLGRNALETETVISAARRANKLLGVDMSYRHTCGMREISRVIRDGQLGRINAVEAVFHNGYGPEKPWFYSRRAAGGGCLLDLAIHLLDLAFWCLDFPQVTAAHGWFHESARGESGDRVEDHAVGSVWMDGGTHLQIACSWHSHAGCDADIRMQFFGTEGGACFRNNDGSFYDFVAEHFHGNRSRELLALPPDDWGGRAVVDWVCRLMESTAFDPEVAGAIRVAETIDQLYRNRP
jgi:predicted dehydrogenase